MITSAENQPWHGDVPIFDLATAGLPAPSVIRTAKIATIEIGSLEMRGWLSVADARHLRRELQILLPGLMIPA